jgi:spore maturation protein CgeB
MNIVIFGLSITSAWGNGHATTYRALVRELERRGHDILFLEREQPWYAQHRDLERSPHCRIALYGSVREVRTRFSDAVADADAVIVGSYVPEGARLGKWVTDTAQGTTAFYDIDTPVTLGALTRGECDYLSREVIGLYDLYLSFTGGPVLRRLEQEFGARRAAPLYCSVDPLHYFPEPREAKWDIGYLGTYAQDRQPALEKLLLAVARERRCRSFVVAGPQYPDDLHWPENVHRIEHLAPREHRAFYNEQTFTLNLTRAAMVDVGFSPSVRLFEAAACGVPIISDRWSGIETFFEPGREILLADSTEDVLALLHDLTPEEGLEIGLRARERVLEAHTAAHRARELERLLEPAKVLAEVTR